MTETTRTRKAVLQYTNKVLYTSSRELIELIADLASDLMKDQEMNKTAKTASMESAAALAVIILEKNGRSDAAEVVRRFTADLKLQLALEEGDTT